MSLPYTAPYIYLQAAVLGPGCVRRGPVVVGGAVQRIRQRGRGAVRYHLAEPLRLAREGEHQPPRRVLRQRVLRALEPVRGQAELMFQDLLGPEPAVLGG